MNLKKLYIVLVLFLITPYSVNSEESLLDQSDKVISVYSGMFDFSDDGKRSTLIGIQHQNENLNRDTFLGNLSPITVARADTPNIVLNFLAAFPTALSPS